MERIKAEGRLEGKAEGIAEGEARGKRETMLATAKRMLKDGILALKDADSKTLARNGADGASWTTGENWLDGERLLYVCRAISSAQTGSSNVFVHPAKYTESCLSCEDWFPICGVWRQC